MKLNNIAYRLFITVSLGTAAADESHLRRRELDLCTICTNVPSPYMTNKAGKDCDTGTWFINNRCNTASTNSAWLNNQYCQQSCFDAGNGYDGVVCCDVVEETDPPTSSAVEALVQYTPDLADWSTFYTKPAAVGSVTDHTPGGIGWLSNSWVPWDGTVYDPTQMSRGDFYNAICTSGGNTIRGMREAFENAGNLFTDPHNPTKAEVDEWHCIAINHLRALVGLSGPLHEVQPDTCLFARALWAQEARWTTKWDHYVETDPVYAKNKNNCVLYNNPHCGDTFIPLPEDQVEYLPEGHPACTRIGTAPGITGAPKSNIPWSTKWVRAFCSILDDEGFWGGHTGPFFRREKFGWSFWDNSPGYQGSNAVFHGRWGGTKNSTLYPNPSK